MSARKTVEPSAPVAKGPEPEEPTRQKTAGGDRPFLQEGRHKQKGAQNEEKCDAGLTAHSKGIEKSGRPLLGPGAHHSARNVARKYKERGDGADGFEFSRIPGPHSGRPRC